MDFAQLDFAGNTLRAWNAEIKAALAEVGAHPGTMTASESRALLDAQTNYDRLREAYEFCYRSVYGTVPAGLSGVSGRGVRIGLGAIIAPIALSNPATALVLIVAAIAAGGIAWQAMNTFRDALQVWRDRQLIGAGINPGSVYGQENDIGKWIEDHLLWVAGGVLGLVLILRR